MLSRVDMFIEQTGKVKIMRNVWSMREDVEIVLSLGYKVLCNSERSNKHCKRADLAPVAILL
jgi:hypothetical protein